MKNENAYYTDNTFKYILPYCNRDTINNGQLLKKCEQNEYFVSYILWRDIIKRKKKIAVMSD